MKFNLLKNFFKYFTFKKVKDEKGYLEAYENANKEELIKLLKRDVSNLTIINNVFKIGSFLNDGPKTLFVLNELNSLGANIRLIDYDALFRMCCKGNNIEGLRAVDYFTKNHKIKINVHDRMDIAFKDAAAKNYTDILEYLIMDMNIEKTKNIEMHINKMSNKHELDRLFETKTLYSKLEDKIKINPDKKDSSFKI